MTNLIVFTVTLFLSERQTGVESPMLVPSQISGNSHAITDGLGWILYDGANEEPRPSDKQKRMFLLTGDVTVLVPVGISYVSKVLLSERERAEKYLDWYSRASFLFGSFAPLLPLGSQNFS